MGFRAIFSHPTVDSQEPANNPASHSAGQLKRIYTFRTLDVWVGAIFEQELH
jgi:hypothetical protein